MNKAQHIDAILNDIEKAELQRFADNRTMLEAVKKVILYGVYFNGTLKAGEPADPMRNFALLLGQNTDGLSPTAQAEHVVGVAKAINLLEVGFANINEYKSPVAAKQEPRPLKGK